MTQRSAVFARPPLSGRVKTRLEPALTATLACDLYRACLEDAFAAARAGGDDERWVYWAEALDDTPSPAGFGTRLQRGEDLGARLAAAFAELLSATEDRVLVLGADCPELTASHLERAFQALRQADVVVGPTRDGGYYLIGLARMEASLFEGVTWSTEHVLEQTRQRAAAAGLRLALLEPLEDLDTPADLVRFIERASSPGAQVTHARRALEAMGLLAPAGR